MMSGWLTMALLITRRAWVAAVVAGTEGADVSFKINFRSAVGCGGGSSIVGFFFCFLGVTVVNPASASSLAEVAGGSLFGAGVGVGVVVALPGGCGRTRGCPIPTVWERGGGWERSSFTCSCSFSMTAFFSGTVLLSSFSSQVKLERSLSTSSQIWKKASAWE
jgi:hypothetical protein